MAGQVFVVAALVFGPFAFGGTESWTVSVLAVLSFTALACAISTSLLNRDAGALLSPVLAPLVLGMLLVEAQLLPWPAGLLRVVSPLAYRAHNSVQQATGVVMSFRPSLHPYGTFLALVRFSSYVALFAATSRLVVSRRDVERIAAWVLGVGFCVALFGLIQRLSGTHRIYWWISLPHGASPFGPFVSRNQFAAYAAICAFAGAGLLLGRVGRSERESSRSWLEGLRRRFSERTAQSLLMAFAIALIAATVFVSLSRGGMLSLLTAGGVVLVLLALDRSGGRVLYVVGGLAVVLAWVAFLGWQPVMERFSSLTETAANPGNTWRIKMFGDALRIGMAAPLLGTGAGTFPSVYPMWRTLQGPVLTASPHNEYLHLFAETGIAGVLLLLATAALVGWTLVRGFVKEDSPWAHGFIAGGVGAIVAPMVHSLVDFPFRSPALACTFVVVLALLIRAAELQPPEQAADEPGGRGQRKRTGKQPVKTLHHSFERRNGRRSARRRGLARATALGLLVLAAGWFLACDLALDPLRGELLERRAQRLEARAKESPGSVDVRAALDSIEARALETVPEDALLYSDLADLARIGAGAAEDGEEKIALAYRALQLRKMAARLEPLNSRHNRQLAVEYLRFQKHDLAATYAERVFKLVPRSPVIWARVARDFARHGAHERALEYMARARALAEQHQMETVRADLDETENDIARLTAQ